MIEQQCGDAGDHQESSSFTRSARDLDQSHDDQHISGQRHKTANETGLLTCDGENKIVMDFRNEAKLTLSAFPQSVSTNSSRTDRYLRLIVLIAEFSLCQLRPVDCLDPLALVALTLFDVRHSYDQGENSRA